MSTARRNNDDGGRTMSTTISLDEHREDKEAQQHGGWFNSFTRCDICGYHAITTYPGSANNQRLQCGECMRWTMRAVPKREWEASRSAGGTPAKTPEARAAELVSVMRRDAETLILDVGDARTGGIRGFSVSLSTTDDPSAIEAAVRETIAAIIRDAALRSGGAR